MPVADYAARFEKLSTFCSDINGEDVVVFKCVKFESGLCPKTYQYVSILETHDFDTLVNKCRIFDDMGKAKANHFKAVNERKGKGQDRGKLYAYGKDKGMKKYVCGGSKPNVGDARCFKYGALIASELKVVSSVERQFISLMSVKVKKFFCYKCGEAGHACTMCTVTLRFPNINSYKEYQSFSSKTERYIQLTKIPLYK